jgi:sulfite exporter TauE/SafE
MSEEMGFGLAFLTGLLMGTHCVGMCGGFVLAYVSRGARRGPGAYLSHFLYGAGKLISYTAIGAMFGLVGSFIAFTPAMRATVAVLAGVFLVFYGLYTLGLFPALRRFVARAPSPLGRVVDRETRRRSHPFAIGLLGGLMVACGPLGAMYVVAAGTGSAWQGALLLACFGAGTLPALVGFGVAASFVSLRLSTRVLKVSALVVIVLGIVMINRGVALSRGDGGGSEHHMHGQGCVPVPGGTSEETRLADHVPVRTKDSYTPRVV